MDPRDAWIVMFAGVASIRLHPKNFAIASGDSDWKTEIDFACWVTDYMFEKVKERFGGAHVRSEVQ